MVYRDAVSSVTMSCKVLRCRVQCYSVVWSVKMSCDALKCRVTRKNVVWIVTISCVVLRCRVQCYNVVWSVKMSCEVSRCGVAAFSRVTRHGIACLTEGMTSWPLNACKICVLDDTLPQTLEQVSLYKTDYSRIAWRELISHEQNSAFEELWSTPCAGHCSTAKFINQI